MPQDGKQRSDWRVTFWFLSGDWIQVGFAFVEAKSEQLAIARCAQRAERLGFHVDKDTKIAAVGEAVAREAGRQQRA